VKTSLWPVLLYLGENMNRDDVIRMAKEASVPNSWDLNWYDPYYERFAKLVAAAEREACAKVCEEWGDPMGASLQIRARGQE
jgi:hypothetical protein